MKIKNFLSKLFFNVANKNLKNKRDISITPHYIFRKILLRDFVIFLLVTLIAGIVWNKIGLDLGSLYFKNQIKGTLLLPHTSNEWKNLLDIFKDKQFWIPLADNTLQTIMGTIDHLLIGVYKFGKITVFSHNPPYDIIYKLINEFSFITTLLKVDGIDSFILYGFKNFSSYSTRFIILLLLDHSIIKARNLFFPEFFQLKSSYLDKYGITEDQEFNSSVEILKKFFCFIDDENKSEIFLVVKAAIKFLISIIKG